MICRPRSAGGLQVLDLITWNKAAIGKLLWALAMKKEKLWVLWVHTFYIKGQDLSTMPVPKQPCWIVRKFFEARKWMQNQVDLVQSLQPMMKDGTYSIKTAYGMLQPQFSRAAWRNLVLVKGALPRHQFILWIALHQRLATVDRLTKWVIQVQKDCVLCNSSLEETFGHLFFECHYSRYVWCSLLRWMNIQRQPGDWNTETGWMQNQLRNSRPRAGILGFMFAAAVYNVWIEMNNRRFKQKAISTTKMLREIALQVHIAGQQKQKWLSHLSRLQGVPT
ncbi:uncharacterized protein LOC132045218 isoform X2 [Lycium ferocissimum]|uniref:uncharacterized protein LOC132045218 isoform X2 n=1 Tax=Lycium ferocissimum TaxID=112874 RepID=UPI002816751C|nr:uncharacterized protein LOC132045218 isoform X2 [Lycium ferocissimum]XP_059291747.1 uncharacterized protein LOC132045218 isoform X2 [Lycium ferocissimum]XP_059291748.1 uncharacterized protein LOC132045218 isoform X2 [Lycium ferocissimum]